MLITILSIISVIISAIITYFKPIFKSYLLSLLLVALVILIILIVLWFGLCLVAALMVNKNKEYHQQSKFYTWLLNLTLGFFIDVSRVKVETTNIDLIPEDEKYMFVYNHRSNYDPIIQSYYLRKSNIIHISKPENFDIPVVGRIIRRCCFMPINRENAKYAVKTINQAAEYIMNQQFSIAISPEGTRNHGEELLPFKPGAFNIAMLAKCPIVVCSMHNLDEIHKRSPWLSTTVEMRIIKVLKYEDYENLNTQEIAEIVQKMIEDNLKNGKN